MVRFLKNFIRKRFLPRPKKVVKKFSLEEANFRIRKLLKQKKINVLEIAELEKRLEDSNLSLREKSLVREKLRNAINNINKK